MPIREGDKSAMRPFAKLLCTLVVFVVVAVHGSMLSLISNTSSVFSTVTDDQCLKRSSYL